MSAHVKTGESLRRKTRLSSYKLYKLLKEEEHRFDS